MINTLLRGWKSESNLRTAFQALFSRILLQQAQKLLDKIWSLLLDRDLAQILFLVRAKKSMCLITTRFSQFSFSFLISLQILFTSKKIAWLKSRSEVSCKFPSSTLKMRVDFKQKSMLIYLWKWLFLWGAVHELFHQKIICPLLTTNDLPPPQAGGYAAIVKLSSLASDPHSSRSNQSLAFWPQKLLDPQWWDD